MTEEIEKAAKEKKALVTVPNFENVDLGIFAVSFIVAVAAISAGCIFLWSKLTVDIAALAILFSFFTTGLNTVAALVVGRVMKKPDKPTD